MLISVTRSVGDGALGFCLGVVADAEDKLRLVVMTIKLVSAVGFWQELGDGGGELPAYATFI